MLARQQCRWHHDGDLHAIHGGDECGAHGHFRLAETDITTKKAIHWAV